MKKIEEWTRTHLWKKPQKTNLIIRLKLWILIRIVGNIVSIAYACSKSLFWSGRRDLGRFVSYYDWINFKMEIFHIILNWKMETEQETEIKFMPADYRFCVGFCHSSVRWIFILFRGKLIDTRSVTGEKYTYHIHILVVFSHIFQGISLEPRKTRNINEPYECVTDNR